MVTIRLTRRGATNQPFYHVVVTDSRKRQGGMNLEHVGVFQPDRAQGRTETEARYRPHRTLGRPRRPAVRSREAARQHVQEAGRGLIRRRALRGRARWRSKDSLELGRIGAPYGIKGWVHVQSFTHPPEKLLKYRSWSLKDSTRQGGRGTPAGQRRSWHGSKVSRIETRRLLQGSMISVARSLLPKLRQREFYQADLIGLSVTNLEGVALGEVSHFVETPGGDVMIVRSEGRVGALGARHERASVEGGSGGGPSRCRLAGRT